MRSILPGLLAISAASASAVGIGCLQNNFELVIRTSCGDDGSISKCLAMIVNLERLDEIEQCYIAGGCDTDDARLGAEWFAEACNEYEKPDLKKRASSDTSAEETTSAKATGKTTAQSDAQTTAATTTEETPTTEVSTITNPTTVKSTTASTTSASTASSSTSDSTTSTSSTSSTSASSTSTSSGTTTGTLLCSTTNIVTTKVCSVFTSGRSDGRTIGCTSTTTPLASCAAGNICSTDSEGTAICMKKDDHLTTSGLIVTIVFGAGIGAFSIALIYLKIRERQANKHRAAADRAALLAGTGYGKGKGRVEVATTGAYAGMQSEANLPLMTPAGTHSDQSNQQNYPHNPDEYFDRAGQGTSSRAVSPYDPTRGGGAPPPPPKLHPGLGALN